MNRRALLAGFFGASAPAGAQSPAQDTATLYIPKAHRVEDLVLLQDLMDDFSFADVITASPSLHITHIPVLLDRTVTPYGQIFGHVSRNNAQARAIQSGQPATIVFRGPHAYISPSWYARAEAVPTWNFAAVHATGRLKPINEKDAVHERLAKLIRKFENRYGAGSYSFEKLPDSYVYPMLEGIQAFDFDVESLEGKFKLGQERGSADRSGILEHLKSARTEPSIHDFTAAFYERLNKAG